MSEEKPLCEELKDVNEYSDASYLVARAVKRLKDKIVFNDIYTIDEIFRIIDKIFGDFGE